jgi:hypothetical protein
MKLEDNLLILYPQLNQKLDFEMAKAEKDRFNINFLRKKHEVPLIFQNKITIVFIYINYSNCLYIYKYY